MAQEVEQPESDRVQVLAPKGWTGDINAFLRDASRRSSMPFATGRVALLEGLSRRILQHKRLRGDPVGVAAGFWLRRAHLAKLESGFRSGVQTDHCRVPAGLVLHIAPANVDTMFVFSWALSFLAGNANVVRLTSRSSPLMEDLLDCLDAAFAAEPDASAGNLFISYGHDDAITAKLSAACDTRIIWGGDETVRRLRAVPLNPHAADRAFASKRSLSVFHADAYLKFDAAARDALAGQMAADIAPFGQLACSSPHTVYWMGSVDDFREGRVDFVERLETAMEAKLGSADLGLATRRLNHAFAAAAGGHAIGLQHHAHTTAVFAADSGTAEDEEPCGAGLLMHARIESLQELANNLRADHQTITYFGLETGARAELAVVAGSKGADRIVPVGRALDFGPFWDGFDLWADLTRTVVVQ